MTRQAGPRRYAALMLSGFMLLAGSIVGRAADSGLRQSSSDGWQIPPEAADLANPVALTDVVMRRGAELYRSRCQRCHGREGRGDGPDADPDEPPRDLTDSRRVSRNPEGVMFYKIWNGRSSPKMPASKTDITREEAWTVIHYVTSLRAR